MMPSAARTQTPADGHRAVARRAARGAIGPLFGLAATSLAVSVALALLGRADESPVAAGMLTAATMAAAGAATVLTGLVGSARGVRWPWVVLGAGVLSYSIGSACFFFVQPGLTTFPTTSDFFWLSFYPCALLAIVMLVREHRENDRLGISLDAAIVALAVGALAYKLLFETYLEVTEVSRLVGGQLAYSMLDLAVITMLVTIAAQSRGRAGLAYVLLGLGAVVLLATDLVNVKLLVTDDYSAGTLLDVGWSAGLLLVGLASRRSTSLRGVGALHGRYLYGAVVLSFGIATGLLVQEALELPTDPHRHSPIVIGLAALVLCMILARLVVSVRENDRLARDNESIVQAAGEGIVHMDLSGRIRYANPAALATLGYTLAEMLGRSSHELFHHTRPNGTPYPASECPTRTSLSEGATHRITDELYWRKDGSSFPVDYTTAPIRERGRIVGAVSVFDDVTHQRQLKDQLRHQADHDGLTGLVNRRRFMEEIAAQLGYAQRYSRPGVLLLIDVDSFKFVNDFYGHPTGDKLLCDVAAILAANVRDTDVVARIGGDEFAVLLREAGKAEGIEVARKLISAIRGGSEPSVAASIGIAPFDGASERTPDELLVAADLALYGVKAAGGNDAFAYSGENGPGAGATSARRVRPSGPR